MDEPAPRTSETSASPPAGSRDGRAAPRCARSRGPRRKNRLRENQPSSKPGGASRARARLELVLGRLGLGGLDGLHEAEAAVLERRHLLLLLLGVALVELLEALDGLLEVGLDVLELGLLLLDLGVEVADLHGHELGDLRLLLLGAEVLVLHGAHGHELRLREGLERLLVAAAFVGLEVRGVAVLDRREALDAVGVAQRLARRGAVDVRDEHGLRPLVVLR
mmetsp:Transcript_29613/g.100667  ORF Transcript_29613/g.100667 Transcript_29613/m.100667 type:complete len:221 (+) Transcript_29613:363-1025(+)